MFPHHQANNSEQQTSKVLYQMTELALSESASLVSSLGHSEIRFLVDSINVENKDELDSLFDQNGADMIAICHHLTGKRAGHIVFLIEETMGLLLIKEVLKEGDQLKEMTEMEEEALTEIGNIIINSCLSHYVQILHESVSSMLPTLKRGHYQQIVDELSCKSAEKGIYLVKLSIHTETHDFFAYILWIDHLCQQDIPSTEKPLAG